jgi:hypothetical protein
VRCIGWTAYLIAADEIRIPAKAPHAAQTRRRKNRVLGKGAAVRPLGVRGMDIVSDRVGPSIGFIIEVEVAAFVYAVCGCRLLGGRHLSFQEFRISDRLHLQFRAEAFNVFNHANLQMGAAEGHQLATTTT